jgi:hypothetical protein
MKGFSIFDCRLPIGSSNRKLKDLAVADSAREAIGNTNGGKT